MTEKMSIFRKLSRKKRAKKKTLKFKVKEAEAGPLDCAYVTVEFEDGKVLRRVPVREGEDIARAVQNQLGLLAKFERDRERSWNYAKELVGKRFEMTMDDAAWAEIEKRPKTVEELEEGCKEIRELRKYAEFHRVVTKILIELHREEIENHPDFKAFKKKWEEEASEE